jgi:asparagine synthase (glutamine-hydrolysing)
MCGIAGFIDNECGQNEAEHLIDRMCKVIRHRGPDDQGGWVEEGVALGMRRLSIIDISGGHQPIFNEDGSILIVFNGEIYNYQQLRMELQEKGHHFQTNSDTEAIVHAYEEFGDECVKHLRGMFTFALWDRKRQRLLAARDRFGKKPFNYYWDGKKLIYGSEIKSILEADIPREINHIALDEYLVYRYVPSPNTLFKNVMKLSPGHILIYENGQISTKRYWELPFEPTCNDDEETAIEHTLALLRDAVECRLMSEVPLGAFLSGGIDSSIVVGLMSSMMSQPVKTFSIGFEEDDYSELPFARQVARHFGTEHQEFFVRPDLVSVLPELAWAYDEPFGDASMLPTYYVSKLAREYVTVVLTGDGGDEIFGGYTHYRREYQIQRIPIPLRYLLGYASLLMPNGMRGKKRLRNMLGDHTTRSVHAIKLFPDGAKELMYSPDYYAFVRDHDPYARMINEYRRVAHLDITTAMQYVDARVYLPDDILVKVDKASMLNSLETRAPMLDQYLVEYVSSLPSSVRTHDGTLKYLLKKVAADMLPAEILTRRKQGFAAPIKHWFRGDLTGYASELLDSPRARQRGIFNSQFIRDLLKAHARTSWVNYSEAIWALLCLELWFQVYIDEPSIRIDEPSQIRITSSR